MTLIQKLPMRPVRNVKDQRAKARVTPIKTRPGTFVDVNSILRIGASDAIN